MPGVQQGVTKRVRHVLLQLPSSHEQLQNRVCIQVTQQQGSDRLLRTARPCVARGQSVQVTRRSVGEKPPGWQGAQTQPYLTRLVLTNSIR
jgi:hypothetical protein